METFTININQTDKLFFTSDLHLGHFRIAQLCNRPYQSCKEMNDALIDNWNKTVPPDGIVINCGDLMLLKNNGNNLQEYIKVCNKLNGKQILVRGNHDSVPEYEESGYKKYTNFNLEYHEDNLIKICDMLKIIIIDNSNNQLAIIFACHYPLLTFPHRVYNDIYQVYGHIHTLSDGSITGFDSDIKDKLLPNQYDVGVDQNDYTPVSYNQLISIFNKKHKN